MSLSAISPFSYRPLDTNQPINDPRLHAGADEENNFLPTVAKVLVVAGSILASVVTFVQFGPLAGLAVSLISAISAHWAFNSYNEDAHEHAQPSAMGTAFTNWYPQFFPVYTSAPAERPQVIAINNPTPQPQFIEVRPPVQRHASVGTRDRPARHSMDQRVVTNIPTASFPNTIIQPQLELPVHAPVGTRQRELTESGRRFHMPTVRLPTMRRPSWAGGRSTNQPPPPTSSPVIMQQQHAPVAVRTDRGRGPVIDLPAPSTPQHAPVGVRTDRGRGPVIDLPAPSTPQHAPLGVRDRGRGSRFNFFN